MRMDRAAASLELKLIGERISKRISAGRTLAKSAWNPKTMELPPGQRLLVISPHPDDDAIGCGGTIIKALSQGRKVKIAYLSLPLSGASNRQERRNEVADALAHLGVQEYSLADGEFPDTVEKTRMAIKDAVRGWAPDCVLVPSPLENHEQHLMAFEAYLDLLREEKGLVTVLYEVWGMIIPNLVVDITMQAERKGQAIAAHASQVRMVDYVSMARALNEYRAISSGINGQAEAFLCLDSKQLLDLFR